MLPPKSERSTRTIALDSDTIAVLRAHKGAQLIRRLEVGEEAYEKSGYVFAGPLGEPLDPFKLTDAWRRLRTKADVPKIRLHDLRHFHASLLLQANIHPKIVQERLGHSTISITLDIYSHTVPSLQEKAAQDFADIMRR